MRSRITFDAKLKIALRGVIIPSENFKFWFGVENLTLGIHFQSIIKKFPQVSEIPSLELTVPTRSSRNSL